MAPTANNDMDDELSIPVAANGRMVIPAAIRRAMGIQAGERLLVHVENGELRMATRRHRIQQAQARAAKLVPRGKSLVEELLAERREAARRE